MQKASVKLAAGIALALVSSIARAQAPADAERYAWGPHMMWWDGGWSPMIFGPLFMIFLFVVVIATVVLLVRWLSGEARPPYHSRTGQTPLDTLKDRFARGEIDKDELEERRRVLGE